MDIHRCRFVDYSPHNITAVVFSRKSAIDKFKIGDLRMAVGRSNGDIEIWNPKYNWSHELTLPGSRGRSIEGLCWAKNGDSFPRLFSVGGSTCITEWDLRTCQPLVNYDCNAGVIWSIDASDSGDELAVGCDDGSVVIIDISGGLGSLQHGFICQRQDSRVLSIKWYKGEQLVGGCSDARIRCWSTKGASKGRLSGTMRVDKFKAESTLVWYVATLPSKGQIVTGDSTGSVKFWDIDTYSLTQSFNIHDADVLCLASDANEDKVFTAGVDRKIHQFSFIKSNRSSKWVHNCSRLLHSNDVRSIAVFENKTHSLLVSGGVEKSIVIQSINQFQDGRYRKLTSRAFRTLVNRQNRLIASNQDQTVKIWKLYDGKHKLVSKMNLSDDDNITSIDISKEGDLLAVATFSSVKVFRLIPNGEKKIQVKKIRDENFESLVAGAKLVRLVSSQRLIILNQLEQLYVFKIENESFTFEGEIGLPLEKNHHIPYSNNIIALSVGPTAQIAVASTFSGAILKISLEDLTAVQHTILSAYPHLLEFSSNDKVLALASDNRLHEFFISKVEKDASVLTPWSKRNTEFLPKQFLTLEDKPEGLFVQENRAWIYGPNWLCFFDLSLNIPINKKYQNISVSRKRNKDGLSIVEDGDYVNDMDGYIDEDEENIDILRLSSKQSHVDRLRRVIQSSEGESIDEENKPFWITKKYRSILSADYFSASDIVVIEKSYQTSSSTPAFSLPKLRI